MSESPAISESAGVSCWTGCEEISTAAAFATSWGTAFAGTTGLEVEVAGFTCWLAALGAAGVAGFVGAAGVTLGAGAAFDAAGVAAALAGVAFLAWAGGFAAWEAGGLTGVEVVATWEISVVVVLAAEPSVCFCLK